MSSTTSSISFNEDELLALERNVASIFISSLRARKDSPAIGLDLTGYHTLFKSLREQFGLKKGSLSL